MEKSRGRIERRRLTTSTLSVDHSDWPGLRRFLRLERITTVHGETTHTVSYAITSLSSSQANADRLLHLLRSRWHIESLFWIKDATFGEDHSRIRTGRAAESMSILKNTAINLLRSLKVPNIAAALREHAAKVDRLLPKLGLPTF